MISFNKVFYINITVVVVATSIISGCKKFVEADPPVTRVNAENAYNSPATAISVLTGLYANIIRGAVSPNFATGTSSLSLLVGLSADEFNLSNTNATYTAFYRNALIVNSTSSFGSDYWNSLYDYVYFSNSAIEGLGKSETLPSYVKDQLLGEAKFIRAFLYFYLTNLYGDVPLVTSTDYSKNAILPRSAQSDVYKLIVQDLKEAQDLLSSDFLDINLQKYTATSQRVRPTKWAATALLSRTYLYNKDWANAETQATSIISNTALFDTVSVNNVFVKNSKEAIWQIQPVAAGQNTADARMFVVPTTGFSSSNPVSLSNFLLNAFEAGDLRGKPKNWTDTVRVPAATGTLYFYPYKYKVSAINSSITTADGLTEYLMVLRLGEQYLIRAEARAQQGNIAGAKSDLDVIRKRARLSATPANDKDALLTAILNERQVELFSEWGHRWFDLRRADILNSVMTTVTPIKSGGSAWQSYQQYYPIPLQELLRNPNLVQTTGYY
jgi:starch-binding outer membrane protein, SusD/RagB family